MIQEHELRTSLNNEIHGRPSVLVQGGQSAVFMVFTKSQYEHAEVITHINKFCTICGVNPPDPAQRYFIAEGDDFTFRWESHLEFYTLTFVYEHNDLFYKDPLSFVDQEWLQNLPGQRVVALHLEAVDAQDDRHDFYYANKYFEQRGSQEFIGSYVSDKDAQVLTDLHIRDNGFLRFLVINKELSPPRLGRLVQRIFEIESYRIMSLLTFPLAKQIREEVAVIDKKLYEVTEHLTREELEVDLERSILMDLISLSKRVEKLKLQGSFRFAAAKAYFEIVQDRIHMLRESRIEGFYRFGRYIARRLSPAMRTCESVELQLEGASKSISRAIELLRAKVDISVQAQNNVMLESLDNRAHFQIKLQETVEGLSIVAISYYLMGLLGYFLKGLGEAYPVFKSPATLTLFIPVVLFGVWITIKKLKKKLARDFQ
jgi:uncharacterized membrane-anchored protein